MSTNGPDPLATTWSAFEAQGCVPRGELWRFLAACPVDPSHGRSVMVLEGADGRAVIDSGCACGHELLLTTLGLRLRDLDADNGRPAPTPQAAATTPRAFPPPLLPVAYVGVLGRLVGTIRPHSEADPAAILAQLIAAVGCLLGRRSGWQVEGDFHAPAVWPVIVGASSTARKGTSGGRVRQVINLVDCDFLASREVVGLSSGEGLIAHVAQPEPDEDPDAPPAPWDPRLLVSAAEFAQVLRMIRREGNVLSSVLRDLWDHGKGQTLTRHNPLRCSGVHVVLSGHITDAELRRELTQTDRANGFGNRFIFIAARRQQLLPFGGALDPADLAADTDALRANLDHAELATRGTLIGFTPAAARLWEAAYPLLTADRGGLAGALCTRAEAQTRRIAVIHALANGADTVDVDHLTAAMALWIYAEQSAAWALGDALGDPDADRLADIIRGHPGPLDRDTLRRLEGSHMKAPAMDAALGLLERQGRIRCWQEPSGGRPRLCAESVNSVESPRAGALAHLSTLSTLITHPPEVT